jgi:hypothetical protein
MTDQELINRGEDARLFKEYFNNSEYFQSLMEGTKNTLKELIYELKPYQQMEFTVLRSALNGVEKLFDNVESDLFHGKQAMERMQGGVESQKGIL